MCYRDNGTAVYTGLERITGQLAGRSGSSGTGDLAGLRGQGSSVAASGPGGTFTFEYDLG
jgi:hypothetical protein